jgi:DNA-binding NarL/FixJ family response regulator
MINLNEIKITPRDQEVLRLLVQGHQPPHRKTTSAHTVLACRNQRRSEASEARYGHVHQGAGATMQPRDRLTAEEIRVATLVWQGLTNKDIAGVLRTSEQVVKNYLSHRVR